MITIHEKTAQKFDTLGLGALLPGSCVVTEEVNGVYELKMKHPCDEQGKWKRVERSRILYAPTPRGMQPFRIYHVKPTMEGITVNARHIFYDLLDNQCSEISFNGTASGALAALQSAFSFAMPFSFDTDISVSGEMKTGRMNPVQVLLSDDDEATSFAKGFGGELLRDGFHVSLLTTMGQDRDITIRYGKNLVGLDVTEDEADVKTRIQYHGSDGSGTLDSPFINEYVYPKIHLLEDENKKKAELKAEAQALFDGGIDIPLVNIKVDFIVLADTVEYADYAPLEEVFLGDIVTIINQKMNFAKRARVISYEWDCLLEKYNEIELGDFMPTLASSVTSGVRSGYLASEASVTSSAVAAALQAHMQDKNNPHEVTAEQTGGSSGGSSDSDAVLELLAEHEENKENPHEVTAAQVGTYTKEEIDEKIGSGSGGIGQRVLYGCDLPDDTIGNNGDVYIKTVEITDYTELETIQSSGKEFVNTGVSTADDVGIQMDVEIATFASGQVFAGSRGSGDTRFWFGASGSASSPTLHYGWKTANQTSASLSGRKKINFNFLNDRKVAVDDVVVGNITTALANNTNEIYIFCGNQAGTASFFYPLILHRMKVSKGNDIVRDFIPVKDENNTPCLYDKVQNKYYYNIGSGTFAAGLVDGGAVYMKQNGTWTQVLKGAA